MTRRMLDSAIWKNEKFGVMPPMARLLAIGIINQADDQGRGKAHPVYLRSQVFPYDDVTAGQVAEWLGTVATNETILLYQVDGKDYYQILNWWSYQSHQYAMPSQYPKPDGWKDRIRKTLTKGVIVTCNWITTDGKLSPDTCDEQGLAIQVNNQVNVQVNNQVKVQDYVKDKDKDYDKDADFAAAVAAWHSGGQMLSKTIADDIGLAIDDWRERGYPGYVADAITEATRQGKLTWKYVEGILKRCARENVAPTKKNGSDPAKKPATGTFRQPSPDGTQWIHIDMATGKEVKREPRSEEEAMF